MPWSETCAMDERMRFVVAASEDDAVMSELCAVVRAPICVVDVSSLITVVVSPAICAVVKAATCVIVSAPSSVVDIVLICVVVRPRTCVAVASSRALNNQRGPGGGAVPGGQPGDVRVHQRRPVAA